jgi:hypothetical protein
VLLRLQAIFDGMLARGAAHQQRWRRLADEDKHAIAPNALSMATRRRAGVTR